jgi:hypothetical protein
VILQVYDHTYLPSGSRKKWVILPKGTSQSEFGQRKNQDILITILLSSNIHEILLHRLGRMKGHTVLFPQAGQNFACGGNSFLHDEHTWVRVAGDPQLGQKLHEDGIFSEHFGQAKREWLSGKE